MAYRVACPRLKTDAASLGITSSHTSTFKAFRYERNSHAAIVRNEIVRLFEKLVCPSRCRWRPRNYRNGRNSRKRSSAERQIGTFLCIPTALRVEPQINLRNKSPSVFEGRLQMAFPPNYFSFRQKSTHQNA